ncbi:alpha-L-fucosidase [Halosquirtibacter xylanolyticus]|uniref:alpha-L-fucosidase n=1 Tax=Halosquirtibacter xylanolyticus TaxID=3374599 RepID=UPI0037499267|nr:alpha-L-fucosidase [Prolixibacteraceae bacterium]
MKYITLLLCILCLNSSTQASDTERYNADWNSLQKHTVPQWAKDVKFGIYAHWGVYSVSGGWDHTSPNWANDYITGYLKYYHTNPKGEMYQLFNQHVGNINEGVGYKDMANLFKAKKFDPVYWADLIEKSGAKYAGIAAVHHDGFCMWDSDITDLCIGKLGAKRDVMQELYDELNKREIKTIATFHHGRTYAHYQAIRNRFKNKKIYDKIDLFDPQLRNYYWFMGTEDEFSQNRYDLTVEFINKYKPDILWFDAGGGKFSTEKILSHFFNMGIDEKKEVSVHNKGNFGKEFGVYSYENGSHRASFIDWPWEDDTPSAVGWCDWQWANNIVYKKPRHIIVRLCDLVSRNGGLLLSMNPRPDGTFDREQEELLLETGKWLKQNGEAIYNTTPWAIYGEGHLENLSYVQINPKNGNSSREIQPNTELFNKEDFRFTMNGDSLYAMALSTDYTKSCLIKTLSSDLKISSNNQITKVTLLGHGEVTFNRTKDGLLIHLPSSLPNKYALVFKIEVDEDLIKRENGYPNSIVEHPPLTIKATKVSRYDVKFEWEESHDNFTGYFVKWAHKGPDVVNPVNGFRYTDNCSYINKNNRSFDHNKLSPSTTYKYKVFRYIEKDGKIYYEHKGSNKIDATTLEADIYKAVKVVRSSKVLDMISLSNIHNDEDRGTGGYLDYKAKVIDLIPGKSYEMKIEYTIPDKFKQPKISIWIDLDLDGFIDFEDECIKSAVLDKNLSSVTLKLTTPKHIKDNALLRIACYSSDRLNFMERLRFVHIEDYLTKTDLKISTNVNSLINYNSYNMSERHFTVSPNPVINGFYIHQDDIQQHSYEIINIEGEVVSSFTTNGIDTMINPPLKKGIYIIRDRDTQKSIKVIFQ